MCEISSGDNNSRDYASYHGDGGDYDSRDDGNYDNDHHNEFNFDCEMSDGGQDSAW